MAISASLFISLLHSWTFSVTYFSMKVCVPSAAPRCLCPSFVIWMSVPTKRCVACSMCSSFTMSHDSSNSHLNVLQSLVTHRVLNNNHSVWGIPICLNYALIDSACRSVKVLFLILCVLHDTITCIHGYCELLHDEAIHQSKQPWVNLGCHIIYKLSMFFCQS